MRTHGKTVAAPKAKRSFTLSPESIEFLDQVRKKRHATSLSSVLDEILRAARHREQLENLENEIAGYYTSLPPSESVESTAWGEFALAEFPDEASD